MPSEHIQETSKQRVQDVFSTSSVQITITKQMFCECFLSDEMVLRVRTLNMLQVLDLQVLKGFAIQGGPICADYRILQKGAARVVHSTVVKKL